MTSLSKGMPGKPGLDAIGQHGGAGGQGGQGGLGEQLGGPGGAGGSGGPGTNGGARGDVQRALWALVVATAVLFMISIGVGAFSYVTNTHRINDIQQARIASCQRTYRAFDEVFKPFFPPHKQTPVEKKLHKTVHHFLANCSKQVRASR